MRRRVLDWANPPVRARRLGPSDAVAPVFADAARVTTSGHVRGGSDVQRGAVIQPVARAPSWLFPAGDRWRSANAVLETARDRAHEVAERRGDVSFPAAGKVPRWGAVRCRTRAVRPRDPHSRSSTCARSLWPSRPTVAGAIGHWGPAARSLPRPLLFSP